jgi:hypothetical protein
MKTRTINIFGFDVEVWNFGYAQYYYPAFNGNAEFKVNSNGFKQLRHYLKTVRWANNIVQNMLNN